MLINYCLLPSSLVQVAGVVGRAESLSALFFLLSIFSYREAVLSSKGMDLIMWLPSQPKKKVEFPEMFYKEI